MKKIITDVITYRHSESIDTARRREDVLAILRMVRENAIQNLRLRRKKFQINILQVITYYEFG